MFDFLYHLPGLLLIYGVFLLQNATPGPNVLAVMGTSMSAGRPAGLAVGFGVAFGTFTWSSARVLGLSAVIASYGQLLFFVKIAGGCYLLFLAYRSLRSAFSKIDHDLSTQAPVGQHFFKNCRKGYLLSMTNPKAALGWVAIVSLGLDAASPFWVLIAIVVGTTTLSLVVHTLYAIAFSTVGMVRIYARARRPVQGALGGLFAFASYKLFTAETK